MDSPMLNVIASSEIHHEYPTLQKKSLDAIASRITDIVYSTLRQKTSQSTTERCNLLKLVKQLCHTPEFHAKKNHYKKYLEVYNRHCSKVDGWELLNALRTELNEIPTSVHTAVSKFFERKNARSKANIKRHELIKQMDEERLKLNFSFSKSISHYETSQSLIDDLLKVDTDEGCTLEANHSSEKDFRERQVGFCYALVNVAKDASDLIALDRIFRTMSSYQVLRPYEDELLNNIWMLNDDKFGLRNKISRQFPFIVENMVIQYCTDIVKLQDRSQVASYFSSLNSDSKLMHLREVCAVNRLLYLKIKNLIFELHVQSMCNKNVYKFIDYIVQI